MKLGETAARHDRSRKTESDGRISRRVEEAIGFLVHEDDGIFRGWLLYYQRAVLNLCARDPTLAADPVVLLVEAFSTPPWQSSCCRNTLCLPKAVSGQLVLARVKLLRNQLLLRYCL